MVREEALKRIQQLLESKRRGMGTGLINDLGGWETRGDSADAAFATGSDEIQSQVAQIEASEMVLIDRALERIREGTYGICECCQKPIPTGRLNALPFSLHCIKCQEEMEEGGYEDEDHYSNWSRVSDAWKPADDHTVVDVGRLAMDRG